MVNLLRSMCCTICRYNGSTCPRDDCSRLEPREQQRAIERFALARSQHHTCRRRRLRRRHHHHHRKERAQSTLLIPAAAFLYDCAPPSFTSVHSLFLSVFPTGRYSRKLQSPCPLSLSLSPLLLRVIFGVVIASDTIEYDTEKWRT